MGKVWSAERNLKEWGSKKAGGTIYRVEAFNGKGSEKTFLYSFS